MKERREDFLEGARARIGICRPHALASHVHPSKKIHLSLPLYSSEQRIRKSVLDPYVHERAWVQRRLPRNVHDAVAAGAAGADEPLSVETLDEHLELSLIHI